MPAADRNRPRAHRRHRAALIAAAAASILPEFSVRAAGVSSTYSGPAAGAWNDPANWSNTPASPNFPNNGNAGLTYDASVGTGQSVTLSSNIVLQKFTLSDATISGPASLTANELVTWGRYGTVDLTGTLTANAGISFNGGGTHAIGAAATVINNFGTATWSFGNFSNAASAVFSNRASFNAARDDEFLGGTFLNAGTFTKTAGTNTTRVTARFSNAGTVFLDTGTLALEGGGTHTGAFQGVGGTTLRFAGGHNFLAAASFGTKGDAVFADGLNRYAPATYFAGGVTTVSAPANFQFGSNALAFNSALNLNGGTISASVSGASITTSGPLNWTAGRIGNDLYANGGFTLDGPDTKSFRGRLLLATNRTGVWNGGDLIGDTIPATPNTSRLHLNGNLDVRTDNLLRSTDLIVESFVRLTKSAGTGTTTLNTAIDSRGTINVNVGTLSLTRSGVFPQGTFTGSAGTTVRFNGDYNFQSQSKLTLDNAIIDGGTDFFDSTSDVTINTLAINAGSVSIPKPKIGALTLAGGTATLGSSFTPAQVTTFNWTGPGSVIRGNSFVNSRTFNITGADPATPEPPRTLTGSVTATNTTFTAFADVNLTGGTYTIPTGGTFDLTGSGRFVGGSIVNRGTFTKTSTADSTWNPDLNNSGTIDVRAGTLRLTGNASHTGTVTVAPGATIALGATDPLNGRTATFAASSVVNAANVILQGGLSVKGAFKVTQTLTRTAGGITFDTGSTPDFTTANVTLGTPGPDVGVSGGAGLTFTSGKPVTFGSLHLHSANWFWSNDDITVNDQFEWTGGYLVCHSFSLNGPAKFGDPAGPAFLASSSLGALNLAGPTTISAALNIGSGTINVAPSATVTVPRPRNLDIISLRINNAGTMTFNGGTATTILFGTVNNSGTVVVSTGTLVLNRPGTHTGHFVVASGATLRFFGDQTFAPGSILDADTVAFSTAGTTDLQSAFTANHTSVTGGTLKIGTPTPLRTRTLTLTGSGRLDVAESAAIIDYDPDAPSPIHSIADAVRNGSILSSAGALAYAQAADVLTFTNNQSTFLGQTVDPTTILIRYTLAGDANLDGFTDFNDLTPLAQNYNSPATDLTWSQGDFTGDGRVDFNDLVKLAQTYNQSLIPPVPGAPAAFDHDFAQALASVPEPTTAALAACGFALSLRRKRAKTPL